MTTLQETVEFSRLPCGAKLAVMPVPGRSIVAFNIRLLAGCAFERPEYLGVALILDEVLCKGTAHYDGQGLNDAFDEIGAPHDSYAGRETFGFSCACLPEFFGRAIELHAEMICRPTFPDEACEVALQLSRQALAALEDDPGELSKTLLHEKAYGEPLGRCSLGTEATLGRIDREAIIDHWGRFFDARNLQIAVAGAVEPQEVADGIERAFEGFAGAESRADSLDLLPFGFSPGQYHIDKDLEQEHVAFCFPGVAVTDDDFAIQCVLSGVLSGGMSGRLFTEVREKQGLVYWVGAWADCPRGAGMLHVGASTTPQRVDTTYETLLREIARLSVDLDQAEVDRAITGLVAQAQTRGDVTRSRAARLADDLFYYGQPVPLEEKLARIRAVTVKDICRFLDQHPRDELCVLTLGPRSLHE